MAKWATYRRETGLIEHICEHGVGHPNAGSIQYMEYGTRYYNDIRLEDDVVDFDPSIPSEPYRGSSWGIHGCDGCCREGTFPGRAAGAIAHAIKRYKELEVDGPQIWGDHADLLKELKERHYLLWWGIMAALREAEGLDAEN